MNIESQDQPMVSVWMVTYNHENYIKQSIESVLMQKTKFPIEIIIGEDCSTDGTRKIIQELESKYPNIIKPIYHDHNVGADRNAYEFCLPRAKGKYIACLEGDDYWLDPYKLQKQVDFLEKNQDFSMCFHNARKIYDYRESNNFASLEEREYSGEEILRKWIVPTASIVFKQSLLERSHFRNQNYIFKDIILILSLAERGKIWCINEVMSVYRRHEGGSSFTFDELKFKKLIKHHEEIAKNFSGVYKEVIKQILCENYLTLSIHQFKAVSLVSFVSAIKAVLIAPKLFYTNLSKMILYKLNIR